MTKRKIKDSLGDSVTRKESKVPDWRIGDAVVFTGTTHYIGSNSSYGIACKGGNAVITGICPNDKHPYHLIRKPGSGATVYGWVNADNITTM